MIVNGCAGAGGWEMGLRALGVVHCVGVEYDPDMVATSRAAGHDCRLGDVSTIDPRELLGDERCEGLVFSPPCPSFSNGGKRLGRQDLPSIHRLIAELADGVDNRGCTPMHDERSRLTVEPMRWVKLLDPDWIALEQVPAVLPVWLDMAEVLRAHGYNAWAGICHAERYGVPQARQRAVLLAHKHRHVGEPVATHRRYYPPTHKLAADPPDAHLPRWISMAEALDWGATERPSMSVTGGGTYTGGAEVFGSGARKGLLREQHSGRWLVHPDMPATTQALRSDDWPVHRPATTIAGDSRVFPPGGHHVPGAQSHGAIRVSVQDAAVLQTFPRDYPFQGTKGKQHQQAGNAMPPALAYACLSELIGERHGNGRLNTAMFTF